MKRIIGLLLLSLSAFMVTPWTHGQRVALKTNLLDYAALAPNLTLEARLSRVVTMQLGLTGAPIDFGSDAKFRLRFYSVEPEVRYWFNRPMARHFLALSATAGSYNLHFRSRHYIGDVVAAGISYGYAWPLSEHWNVEAELGVGLANFSGRYTRAGHTNHNWHHIYPVPIRCGVSFSYIFK